MKKIICVVGLAILCSCSSDDGGSSGGAGDISEAISKGISESIKNNPPVIDIPKIDIPDFEPLPESSINTAELEQLNKDLDKLSKDIQNMPTLKDFMEDL